MRVGALSLASFGVAWVADAVLESWILLGPPGWVLLGEEDEGVMNPLEVRG